MSSFAEIFVTIPIVVTISFLGLTQTKFYYNILNQTKKFKIEKLKEEDFILGGKEGMGIEGDNEEVEFEKYLERKKHLMITKN